MIRSGLAKRLKQLEAAVQPRTWCDQYVEMWEIAKSKLSENDRKLLLEPEHRQTGHNPDLWARWEKAVIAAIEETGIEGYIHPAAYFF